jgi:glycine cleavage system H lipoate-binding protein/ABC-type phosphate transport system substrate-binding protein
LNFKYLQGLALSLKYRYTEKEIEKQMDLLKTNINIMKNLLSTLSALSFLLFFTVASGSIANDNSPGEQQTSANEQYLEIVCSPELTSVASNWVANFRAANPGVEIVINESTDEKAIENGKLYLLTSNHKEAIEHKSLWEITIGHDVIVPIINTKNPLKDKIFEKGITTACFSKIVSENGNWSEIIESDVNSSFQCYLLDHPQVISKVAGCANISESELSSKKVTTVENLVSAIQNNETAIGFCRLIDIMDANENSFASNISILPFDKNQNGRIDGFEKIYSSPKDLSRGVWIGKYPKMLSGEIYAAAAFKPTEGAAHDFLEWAITDGQETLAESGFSNLSSVEKTAGLLAMRNSVSQSGGSENASGLSSGWKYILGMLAVILLIVALVRTNVKNTKVTSETSEAPLAALNENSILAPGGLFYDKTHTWAFMEENGRVKIGINDFLQHITGSVTKIRMKGAGEKIRKGEKILTLMHQGKQLTIYSPVTGVIKQQNEALLTNPSKLNSAPYTNGWVYQIEPANWVREISFMFMADRFRDWMSDEFTRLKDFMAVVVNASQVRMPQPVLQDGGELTDHVLANLDPEVWEEFQSQFIDTSK